MDHDTTIATAIAMLLGAFALNIGLRRWRKAKGRSSVFAADASLDDIGLSAISAIDTEPEAEPADGAMVLRPALGIRILAPVIAGVFLYTVDIDPLLHSVGISDGGTQHWTKVILGWMLVYSVIHMNLFQKVAYSDTDIACTGVDIRTQYRDLSDLVDIAVHDKRPALVLTFANQKPLYVPKFITQRSRFISDMAQIAANNRAKGMTPPASTLATRLGF